MSEVVERVALAIATHVHINAVKFNLREINQADSLEAHLKLWPIKVTDADRELARIAIEAMREPTEEMVSAVGSNYGPALEADWRAMIDAALISGS